MAARPRRRGGARRGGAGPLRGHGYAPPAPPVSVRPAAPAAVPPAGPAAEQPAAPRPAPPGSATVVLRTKDRDTGAPLPGARFELWRRPTTGPDSRPAVRTPTRSTTAPSA
ncbi:hypothetical protein WKI68_15160 [Streptomyces sp. MS1.HAVA.3]|uniref:Uncharacterized protein n=1 Tax=Streptomyces caledonius TaxID=3134107 RepID=A0ABU8U3E1_9ACTN